MFRKINLRKLFFKCALCLLTLPVLFSLMTTRASLQNTNSTSAVKPVNVNASPRKSPRSSSRNNANSAANSFRSDYQPTPTPEPANSTVRGRVLYADTGRPVKRSPIMLMRKDSSNSPSSTPSALTDGEGVFQMKNVSAGIYYVVVNAPGVVSPFAYADLSQKTDREALKYAFENFEKIVVDGVNDVDAQIVAQRGGAIGGRVIYDDGDPAIGVKVEILRKVDETFVAVIPNLSVLTALASGNNQYQTDDRGVYRFAGLPPGEYIVKVTEYAMHGVTLLKNNYDPFNSTLGNNSFLTVFFPDASETKQAQTINVQPGQEMTEINLVLPSRNSYKLEGRVINRQDKSPVKARLTLKKEGDEHFSILFNGRDQQSGNAAVTDEKGNWKFKDLPKGTYKITIEPLMDESEYRQALGDYSNANVAANVDQNVPPKPNLMQKTQEIFVDQNLTETVIEMGYGAVMSGTARVENSEEMPFSLSIVVYDEMNEWSADASIINKNAPGNSRDSKINHDFKLEGIGEGRKYFMFILLESEHYVKSVTHGGVDLLANPFEVKEGEEMRNVQIILSKDVGTIKGMVINNQGQPSRGAQFMIAPTDVAKRKNLSFYRPVMTDPNGEFEIKTAPGEYAVFASDLSSAFGQSREEFHRYVSQSLKDAQIVKVEAGKTETVTIKGKN